MVVHIPADRKAAYVVSIPRDSYVPIPGHGSDKINASMVYGGPQLTARTVQGISGVRFDYVFLTDFRGFASMIHTPGGIRVRPLMAMNDLGHSFGPHLQLMDGLEALAFSRIRHGLPGGDFDRTLNQGRVLKAGLDRARALADEPGKYEHMMMQAIKRMDTDLSPIDLYRLGRVMLTIHPNGIRNCRITGGFGSAGGASIVVPDLGRLRRLAHDARGDGVLDHGLPAVVEAELVDVTDALIQHAVDVRLALAELAREAGVDGRAVDAAVEA